MIFHEKQCFNLAPQILTSSGKCYSSNSEVFESIVSTLSMKNNNSHGFYNTLDLITSR